MFNSNEISQFKPLLILCLLALACATATPASGHPLQGAKLQRAVERNPGKGLRIIEVLEGRPAQNAGLRPMDLLSRYGEFEIVDHASYFAARDTYEKSPGASVQIVVWRGNKRMTLIIPSGRLGIVTNEYNPVLYQFSSLMDKVNGLREIPEYMRDREFKDQFVNPPEKILEEARRLIDCAEQEHTLTPAQVLVARIYLILDDAPPEDLKKQSDLLAQLLSTQPESYIEYLGDNLFFEKKRYRAAIECFKKHLEVDPSDVSDRLNLGFAYYHLGMSDEAESAADYVLDNKLGLSEHGFVVACQVKAMAALGHHDYPGSISFAERSFELNHETFDISLVQLAAAQTGDLQKLEEASNKFREDLPEKYKLMKFQVDAVEAYALVKNNQRERARQLIIQWKDQDRIEGKLSRYWGKYPGGSDVVKNWKELMQD